VNEEFLVAGKAVENPGWLWSMDLSAIAAAYPPGSNRGIIGSDYLAREFAALDYGTHSLQLGILAAIARRVTYGLSADP
jgi:hypothetical protein